MRRRLVKAALLLLLLALHAAAGDEEQCRRTGTLEQRPHSITLTEFGAVGDGVTLNTVPFQNAVFYLRSFADKGGAQLYVPRGRWLTGSFNLTSHLTLFLEDGAVIVGTQDPVQWPIVSSLPSYSSGGGRHQSLINGYNVTDVVITGNNGVIDGQGSVWWQWFEQKKNHSRPSLVEFLGSTNIAISNLTLKNSPARGIHPVYSSNVNIQNVNIQMPPDSPLTDGIVPDSCTKVCIEGGSISVGHDAIALKSGWDSYGISLGMPTSDVHIIRADLQGSSGSAIAFGSEMSGGISDIHIEQLQIRNSSSGILFGTAPGRGGYINNIMVTDVAISNVGVAIELTGDCASHPPKQFDPSDVPVITRITLKNMVGDGISVAGILTGIKDDPFTNICLSNLTFSIAASNTASAPWSCSYISGFSELVIPEPCADLRRTYPDSSSCFTLPQLNALAAAA